MKATIKVKSNTQIKSEFEKLTQRAKIEVLSNALGIMESANSQSQMDCIAKGMGYSWNDGIWNGEAYVNEGWVKE